MNAIILAAGYGKRILNVTKKIPKCLIKIHNEPILVRWIKILKRSGIKKILINIHYKKHLVLREVEKYNFRDLQFVQEKKLLGTAGTLAKNISFFENNDGLVLHADNYSKEKDLNDFIKFHKKKNDKKKITIFGFKTVDYKNSGIFEFDGDDNVVNFYEKNYKKKKLNIANGAIYIFKHKYLKEINNLRLKDISKDIVVNNLDIIKVYKSRQKITDIGIPKNYSILRRKKIINEK